MGLGRGYMEKMLLEATLPDYRCGEYEEIQFAAFPCASDEQRILVLCATPAD